MLLPSGNNPPRSRAWSQSSALGTGPPSRTGPSEQKAGSAERDGRRDTWALGSSPVLGGGDREGRWSSQRTGSGGKNQYDTASQGWDIRASWKRKKAKIQPNKMPWISKLLSSPKPLTPRVIQTQLAWLWNPLSLPQEFTTSLLLKGQNYISKCPGM